ncbi:hypothetical protein KEM52_003069, partial [Ascosphaera acerosa]
GAFQEPPRAPARAFIMASGTLSTLSTARALLLARAASCRRLPPVFVPALALAVRHYTNPALSTSLQMDIPDRKLRHIPTSGTYPQGFKVGAAHAGVKASNRPGGAGGNGSVHPDVALLASVAATPCAAAAVFTTNKFQAAPVQVSREVLRARQGRGVGSVVINAGCANAVTGKKGIEDARAMARQAEGQLQGKRADADADAEAESSLVMSTGVIGQL